MPYEFNRLFISKWSYSSVKNILLDLFCFMEIIVFMMVKPYFRNAYFYETDQMGIIHHSNFIRWFEEARGDFLEHINFPFKKVSEFGIYFPVLDVYCEYKSMVYFGDSVNIHVSLSEMENIRMTVNHKIVDVKSGEIRALGKTKHLFYDNINKRPISIKKVVPEFYQLFCDYIISE